MKEVSNNKLLLKLIDSKEIISFDIFDTLIKRNCQNPTDIFDIVELQYNIQHKTKKINNFKKNRIEAEKKARTISNKEDIDIYEIYKQLAEYDLKINHDLLELEIKSEEVFCCQNKEMYNIYEYCKNKGKKIICISDMYLPTKIIKNILKQNGYNIEQVFVSSDIGKQKRSGNLFKHAIETLNLNKKDILHIGDSKRGDFLQPNLLGITSYLIPRYKNNCQYIENDNTQDLNKKILYSYINNSVVKYDDEYFKIGYELLGPVIYSFCKWIHYEAKQKQIDKLFFCARDMQFTQKVYNLIYQDKAIKNEYLYISRKSIEQPYSYKNNNFHNFLNTITDKKLLIHDILRNKGIKIHDLEIKLKKYGIDHTKEYNNSTLNNKKMEKFYNEILKKEIELNSKEQYESFIHYMKHIDFNPNKSAIVDLGWKGTIQYSLNSIYSGNNILGFYLGLDSNAYPEIQNKAFGYIFDKCRNNDISEKIYSFRSLFEMFFLATHGTTLRYDKNTLYQLGEYENKNNELVKKIQDGAMQFIVNFIQYNQYIDNINIESIINDLVKIGTNPSYKQTVVFGNLNFDNMICGKLAKPQKLTHYIIKPKDLKKDIFRSEWKVGFLKRLLRINLPYYQIYKYLKKKKS